MKNKSRPIAAAYLILITFAACGPGPAPGPTPGPDPGPPPADVPGKLLAEHNIYRATKSLPPLTASPKLQASAQGHADFMVKRGKLAHDGIGDGSPWDRIAATGYVMSAGGENIAWNQQDIAAVMRAWIGSPGHKRNIVGAFTEFGGAVAYGPKKDPYWVTVFATPGRAAGPMVEVRGDDGTVTGAEGGLLIPPARIGGP